MTITGWSTPIV